MPKPSPQSRTISPSCADALKQYRAKLANGERISIDRFVAEHPAIAEELRTVLKKLAASPVSRNAKQRPQPQDRETHSTGTLESQVGEPQPMRSADPQNEFSLPPEFGRYRVEKQLGRGAMGAVYLAHDTQLDRNVALKTPSLEAKNRRQRIERFQLEARAAARLNHEFICTVYDVGEIDGVSFIAMEFVNGKPLSDFVGQPWPERRAVLMVRRLALAMEHAHAADVVHRDLKPANIMIDRQKRPKIMDFGLARQVDADEDESRMTKEGAILGTPAYMSPEQVLGDLDTGPPADIYALGIILFELLTGELPFRGGTTVVLGQILGAETPRLSSVLPHIDPELDAICARAMAKKPEDRYQSMKEFALHLTEFAQGKTAGTSSSDSVPVLQLAQSADPAFASTQINDVSAPPEPATTEMGFATELPHIQTESPDDVATRSSLFTTPPASGHTPPARKSHSNAGLIAISLGFVSMIALLIGGAMFLSQEPVEEPDTVAVTKPTAKQPSSVESEAPEDENSEKESEPEPDSEDTESFAERSENTPDEESSAIKDMLSTNSETPPPQTTIASNSPPQKTNPSPKRGGFGGNAGGFGGGGIFGPRNRTPSRNDTDDEKPDPKPEPQPEPQKPRDALQEKQDAKASLRTAQERQNFDSFYNKFEEVYEDAPGGPYFGTYTLILPGAAPTQQDGIANAAKYMATRMPFRGSSRRYNMYYQYSE